jgi:hypothetical protein
MRVRLAGRLFGDSTKRAEEMRGGDEDLEKEEV